MKRLEVSCKSTKTDGVVGVQEVIFTPFQGTPNQCMHRFVESNVYFDKWMTCATLSLYIKALNLSNGSFLLQIY